MESKAFSNTSTTIHSPVFHSRVCSSMILNVAICSQQNLSLRNPACSFQCLPSRASYILSKMILQRTLLATGRSIIPLQFLHRHKSPFLGSLTSRPTFQSLGMSSSFQTLISDLIQKCMEDLGGNHSSFLPGFWGHVVTPRTLSILL